MHASLFTAHRTPYNPPLSPPRSPYMSGDPTRPKDGPWQYQPSGSIETGQSGHHPSYDYSLHASAPPQHQRPQLKTAQSYQYSLAYSAQPQDGYIPASDTRTSTLVGSAPTSPTSRLSPRSSAADRSGGHEEEEDLSAEEAGEDEEGDETLTAEQRLQQKRKMKRFRLTHNQTRFLMSEFARQAHPDAAHRERLSREIPGLSPRQVQVWFQNRRAKLKRLTADDRERMVRSRQLPDHFDMAPGSLQPTYSAHNPASAPILPTPGTYGTYGTSAGVRPLTLDTLRRLPDYDYAQQQHQQHYGSGNSGLTPAMSSYAFTPPQSGTGPTSPLSAPTSSVPSSYPFHPQDSPRRSSASVPYGNIGSVTGASRPAMDSAILPPRSSLPYGSTHHQDARLPPYGAPERLQHGVQPLPSHSKPMDEYRRESVQGPAGSQPTSYGSYAPPHLPTPNAPQYQQNYGQAYGTHTYPTSYPQHTRGS